jgi:hypothetical protein
MGDWEDLTELFGLDASATWDQIEPLLRSGRARVQSKSFYSSQPRSWTSIPVTGSVEARVVDALRKSGVEGEILVGADAFNASIGIRLRNSGEFVLVRPRSQRNWSWEVVRELAEAEAQVRVALYEYLSDLSPADERFWRSTAEKNCFALFRNSYSSAEVRHSSLRTFVEVREHPRPPVPPESPVVSFSLELTHDLDRRQTRVTRVEGDAKRLGCCVIGRMVDYKVVVDVNWRDRP